MEVRKRKNKRGQRSLLGSLSDDSAAAAASSMEDSQSDIDKYLFISKISRTMGISKDSIMQAFIQRYNGREIENVKGAAGVFGIGTMSVFKTPDPPNPTVRRTAACRQHKRR
ncbi:4120_t:CDS:2 [Paraglomus brasilianum]|uniref:4120_t:CDS:1 n=1 Tax=Paraglomus brasilianum TaxID=144538 RepID=A0A9N9G8W8_9GLOM|nr:4120_t:CDS:2 [Paraglomus brasilianum]